MKPVIGMEIHVELRTKSKMFCGCSADHFGVAPNTQTCPVCLGLPGALPVPNKKAVTDVVMIGLALQCDIAKNSKFDRKHYFYPDLPKGYQISQYDEPFCTSGVVKTSLGEIRITRVHLEEDTAKLQHTTLNGEKVSLVDFNRSSVALVEIVTEPDITSAKQAKEYAQNIQNIIRYLGVSDADMEKGSMRVEANISWGLDLGYKVEVKNINSFRFLEKAIDFELDRQKKLLDKGITPQQETRGWSEAKSQTYTQRIKEDAADYRYFPEPDIPPIVFNDSDIQTIKESMPMLPDAMKNLLTRDYSVREDYVDIIVSDKSKAEKALQLFKVATQLKIDPQLIAKQLVNKPETYTKPIDQVMSEIKAQLDKPTASTGDMEQWINDSLKANPDVVEKYKSGKTAVIGALVGDIMRRSKGQADAKMVNQLLLEKLK